MRDPYANLTRLSADFWNKLPSDRARAIARRASFSERSSARVLLYVTTCSSSMPPGGQVRLPVGGPMLAHSRDIEVRDIFIHLDVAPVDNETYVCSGSGPGLTVRWPEPEEEGPVFIRA